MRPYPPATPTQPTFGAHTAITTAAVADSDQDRMMRGLVHGVILSLALWLTAGYLTLILR